MSYFVISTSEDGDVYFYEMQRERLEEELNDPESGIDPNQVQAVIPPFCELTEKTGIYIIEGRLVTPRIVNTVTSWKV